MEKDDKLIFFNKLTKMFDELTEWLYQGTATHTQSGMMSKEDKVKLDSIVVSNGGLIPCELGCVGNDLVLYTQELLPENINIRFYHYIKRRQKICPVNWNPSVKAYPHRYIKGWRRAITENRESFNATLTLYRQNDGYYGYTYTVSPGDPIVQQAIRLATVPNSRTGLKSNYFGQRMALEIVTGKGTNHTPLTCRLEFMMMSEHDIQGEIVGARYCKIHQRTTKPPITGA